jgi:hypothetical protein
MIKKIIRKIRTFTLLLRLAKSEANDYTFGYKVRRVLNLYKDNKDIKEEEIFKESPKP